MKNGEEKSEPLDEDVEKMDGEDLLMLSPVSSRYSSCGESDFERYGTANSVMGTPSVCSSMGFYHDFGDSDHKNLDGFTLDDEKFQGKFEKRRLLLRGETSSSDRDMLTPKGVDVGSGSNVGIPKQKELFDEESGKKEDLAMLLKNVENVLLQGAVAARSAAETLFDNNHADEMEDERCREQDDASSSRYEHSDGEDSMFNYGSDGGSHQPNVYYVKNGGCNNNHDDDGRDGGNLVLMNPSVAFGSNDWEDFELDGEENSKVSPSFDSLWEKRSEKATEKNEKETESSGCVNLLSVSNGDVPSLKLTEVAESSTRCESDDGSDDYLKSCSFDDVFEKQCLPCLDPVETGFNEEKRGGQDTSVDHSSDHVDHDGQPSVPLVGSDDGSDDYLKSCSFDDVFEKRCQPLLDPVETGFDEEKRGQDTSIDHSSDHDGQPSIDDQRAMRVVNTEGEGFELEKDPVSKPVSSWFENDTERIRNALNVDTEKNTAKVKTTTEMNTFYDELVHEMEQILLDTRNTTSTTTNPQSSQTNSITTTSSSNNKHPANHHYLDIHGIEVVGAKQKTNVSLSERLVGVKGYTVYIIRAWNAKQQWEVERRYRDFYSLYRQLKSYYSSQGWDPPSSWSSIEQESKKYFNNSSPDVIADRSTLIQEFLSSVIQSECCFNPPSALVWFLSPQDPPSDTDVGPDERVSNLGKTVSLIVEVPHQKSTKELLETQHYACAGCHKHFEMGKNRMQEIVKSLGWGRPRLCEYTGQLFCSSCHTNDTAVLPARILHHWDFGVYPVSQIAKSYLDSIVDQPMICVSAANPFLFSRVPTLLHVVGIRRKIGAMLPCIRCSFRRSIYRRLGYRKYLLETRDFFAIRDLIDLSKGVFAALPTILEAVSKKIQEHITELCLECCDSGVPCGARHACENPSCLIFPFQEDDTIERCKSCRTLFHKHCYTKITECPCGAVLSSHTNHPTTSNSTLDDTADTRTDGPTTSSVLTKSRSKSSVGFLSSLFPVSRQGKGKDSDNVILMGSLPTTSL